MSKKLCIWLSIVAVAFLINGYLPSSLPAADVDFSGKTIVLSLAGLPGGSSDVVARMVARYLPNHIPGKPRMLVRTTSRGREIIDFNNFYEKAEKNGQVIGLTTTIIIGSEMLNHKLRRYKLTKMPIIAAFPDGNTIVYNTKISKDYKAMIAMGDNLIASGAQPESPSNWGIMFFKELIAPDLKIIFGYDRNIERTSLLRGETLLARESPSNFLRQWKDDPTVDVLCTMGILDDSGNIARDPVLPDVPTLIDVYQEIHGKLPPVLQLGAYKAFVGALSLKSSFYLPPGTPVNIINTMQKSMASMLNDPGFRKVAGSLFEGYEPVVGKSAEKLLMNSLDQPPEVLAWLGNWLATKYDVRLDK